MPYIYDLISETDVSVLLLLHFLNRLHHLHSLPSDLRSRSMSLLNLRRRRNRFRINHKTIYSRSIHRKSRPQASSAGSPSCFRPCGNNDSVGIDPETAKTWIYPDGFQKNPSLSLTQNLQQKPRASVAAPSQPGVVNALIQHQWRPKSFITVSGEVDSRAIEKSAKIGLGYKWGLSHTTNVEGKSERVLKFLKSEKELHSVRSQLAAEQSRCFKLELEVAEDHKSSSSKILLKMPSKCEILCEILIAVLLPPLGVCLSRGCCTVEFLICLVLIIVGYVPGIIYALYVIVFKKQEEYFNEARICYIHIDYVDAYVISIDHGRKELREKMDQNCNCYLKHSE
ncbi:hypothetical protein HID58_070556 [Brassica napus]|uniref:Acyl-CoA-binding domain-containing protein n=1 Tax=Brassica napus TaxID=3708 RepID=A0ABQ7YZ33_BRANA|nr:hypothetical protein HID58_070556 [Brassica napus]